MAWSRRQQRIERLWEHRNEDDSCNHYRAYERLLVGRQVDDVAVDATQTWSGRGKHPAWVKAALEAGKTLEDLAIGA